MVNWGDVNKTQRLGNIALIDEKHTGKNMSVVYFPVIFNHTFNYALLEIGNIIQVLHTKILCQPHLNIYVSALNQTNKH